MAYDKLNGLFTKWAAIRDESKTYGGDMSDEVADDISARMQAVELEILAETGGGLPGALYKLQIWQYYNRPHPDDDDLDLRRFVHSGLADLMGWAREICGLPAQTENGAAA